jgi:hypothetical protein
MHGGAMDNPVSQADKYRKRAKSLAAVKHGPKAQRLTRKKTVSALESMADNEDWLDGKPGSQLKK